MRKTTTSLFIAAISAAFLCSCAHEPRSAAAGSSRLSCDQASDLAVQEGCNEARPATGGGGMRRGFGSAASAADIGYVR